MYSVNRRTVRLQSLYLSLYAIQRQNGIHKYFTKHTKTAMGLEKLSMTLRNFIKNIHQKLLNGISIRKHRMYRISHLTNPATQVAHSAMRKINVLPMFPQVTLDCLHSGMERHIRDTKINMMSCNLLMRYLLNKLFNLQQTRRHFREVR